MQQVNNQLATVGSIKDHVQGVSQFVYYRDSALWYITNDTQLLFPVPIDDIGTTTFDASYKSIKLMRWIRRYLDNLSVLTYTG